MGNSGKDFSGDEKIVAARAEADRVLEEIKQLRVQAEEQLKAAELARKNADSEGLFAVNAKRTCEEHSTAISALKGAVETDVNSIISNKQKSDELLAAVNASKATLSGEAKIISDRRKEVDVSAQTIIKAAESGAAYLAELLKSKDAAALASDGASEALAATTTARKAAEAALKEAEGSATSSGSLAVEIEDDRKTVAQHAEDIDKLLSGARATQDRMVKLFEHLTKSHEIAADFEARVSKSSSDLRQLIEQTEGMLPGVTSATLASSFSKQKERFSQPQTRWMWIFGFCMLGLLLVGIPSYIETIHSGGKSENWTTLAGNLLLRIPVMVPLVWLAIYAGRNYMLSIRLEEEYAYKEAISTCFEGYKRQMEKIEPGDATNPNPLNTLCRNVLTAMAERPGRIYEGRQPDITPLNEVHGTVASLAKKETAAK